MKGQLFNERGIGRPWRSGSRIVVRAGHWTSEQNCVLKHCLPLKTFIPSYVVFFVLLEIALSCIHKMSSTIISHWQLGKTELYAGHCFIIHFPGGGHSPLARDSEPIRMLEISTSPSLYMLIRNLQFVLEHIVFCQKIQCSGIQAH